MQAQPASGSYLYTTIDKDHPGCGSEVSVPQLLHPAPLIYNNRQRPPWVVGKRGVSATALSSTTLSTTALSITGLSTTTTLSKRGIKWADAENAAAFLVKCSVGVRHRAR